MPSLRTELMLGGLLALMLVGLSVLIRRGHVAPRAGVTVLAQISAGSFGKGLAYDATDISITVVLALAANTSFGGLPVMMSLLSSDNRLPHLFGLRAEGVRPPLRRSRPRGARSHSPDRDWRRHRPAHPAVRDRGVH